MVEPNTSNIGLIIPNDGSLSGTWGSAAINPDMVAIDGLFGGVVSVSLSSSPVTLTSPAGTISAAAGPTQSQNSIIKLTGTLSANVQVTLPLPGQQRIHNLTTGNFVVTLRAVGSGAVVGIPQGEVTNVYNDGTNVYLMLGVDIGEVKSWTGLTAMPSWVTSCTNRPYLLCDGTVYNISDYPYLGNRLLGTFGGNGLTTFAVPDLRGRVSLPYDGTGTRITSAGCGINGQTLGASADNQSVTLTLSQIPTHNHTLTDPGHFHQLGYSQAAAAGPGFSAVAGFPASGAAVNATTDTRTTGITIADAGGGALHTNVQPSIVTGISVIRAG